MTTLSTEDNTRPGADDRDPDGLNPVIEARRRGGTTAGCLVQEGAGNFFETWVI